MPEWLETIKSTSQSNQPRRKCLYIALVRKLYGHQLMLAIALLLSAVTFGSDSARDDRRIFIISSLKGRK
jgi:hypothetical protein